MASCIEDVSGREFWATNFGERASVDWGELVNSLCKLVRCEIPKMDDVSILARGKGTPLGDGWYCLRDLLTVESSKVYSVYTGRAVTINNFGKVLTFFGPLLVLSGTPFLDRVQSLVSEPWFHGDISGVEAEERLRGSKDLKKDEVGVFLVRYSTVPGSFTVSYLPANDQEVKHSRIDRNKDGYVLQGKAKVYQSLLDLLKEKKLGVACAGSKYQPADSGNYADVDPNYMGY